LGILRYICDKEKHLKETYREIYPDVEFIEDFEILLKKKEIDAFIISSTASIHYELTREILTEGKDVFVGKPLSLKVEEGEELVEISEKKGCILMVGHILHYHPSVVKMKEIIKNGDIGEIQYIYSHRLNIGRIRNVENILWSFSPH